MSNPDVILDRVLLKQRLRKWQMAAVAAILFALIALVAAGGGGTKSDIQNIHSDYVARISIDGIILDDQYRADVLADIAADKHAKALIVNIDSPGGTTVGGEALYGEIRKIAESGKPVVVVQRTLAASAAYMASLAADRIYARRGTVTGSIGVLAQSAEVTELAKNLGISLQTFKSSELKASPSPFEKLTPKSAAAMQSVIDDFYNYFVSLVAQRRNMPVEKAKQLADGRVYTGNQAVANGLVDEIGGEEEARQWLIKSKKIPDSTPVQDIDVIEPEKTLAEEIFGSPKRSSLYQRLNLTGLLAIWQM